MYEVVAFRSFSRHYPSIYYIQALHIHLRYRHRSFNGLTAAIYIPYSNPWHKPFDIRSSTRAQYLLLYDVGHLGIDAITHA